MSSFFETVKNRLKGILAGDPQEEVNVNVDKWGAEKKQIAEAEALLKAPQLKGDGRVYHGTDAVMAAARKWNQPHISPIAYHIISEEGFVDGVYKDTGTYKEPTWGVGQTKEWIGKNFFTEVLPAYEEKARNTTKDYAKLPVEAQQAIVSMAYRGDWGKNTRALLSQGKWEAASQEYLHHKNYREGIRKNATPEQKAIAARMRRNSEAIRKLGVK